MSQNIIHSNPCVDALAAIAPGVVGENAGRLFLESQMAGLSAAQMAYVFASAQHETDQGRSMVEYASGSAYEGNDEGPFNLFLIATLIPQ